MPYVGGVLYMESLSAMVFQSSMTGYFSSG